MVSPKCTLFWAKRSKTLPPKPLTFRRGDIAFGPLPNALTNKSKATAQS
jgi:hypothetical protein